MEIKLQGTFNTRDLGGIKTSDGRMVKPHRLIRSDSLFETTTEDHEILKNEYDLKMILDLRTFNELSEQAPVSIPGTTWVHLPLLQSGSPAARESAHDDGPTEKSLDNSESNPAARESKDGQDDQDANLSMAQIFQTSIAQVNYDVPGAMNKMYESLLTDEYSINAIKSFFEILLANKDGAVLWHCTGGKDRTGVLSLLLLKLLGADDKDIMADYLLSEENLKPQTDAIIEEIRKENDDSLLLEQARILNSVLPEYSQGILDNIEKLGGDVYGYANKYIGLTESDIDELKLNYLV